MNEIVKVKSVSSNTMILSNNNPEIFDTSPRPGGYLKLMVPTRSQDYMAADECTCYEPEKPEPRSTVSVVSSRPSKIPDFHFSASTTSREFRLKRAIEETDWELTAVDETDTVVGISNVLQDTINMLAVTISCVMMMAANLEIPEDYLIWAHNYLQCVKDEEGTNPPNIQGIISEIVKRKDDPNYGKGSSSDGKKKGSKPDKSGKSSSKTSSNKKGSESSASRTSQKSREASMSTLSAEKPKKKSSTVVK